MPYLAIIFFICSSFISGTTCFIQMRSRSNIAKIKRTQNGMMMSFQLDLPCNLPIQGATIQLVHGRRCIFIPSRKPEHRNSNVYTDIQTDSRPDNIDSIPPSPPIVVLSGMAQCIESWQHHLSALSKDRDVFMFEYCGSGRGPEHILEHHGQEVNEVSHVWYVAPYAIPYM